MSALVGFDAMLHLELTFGKHARDESVDDEPTFDDATLEKLAHLQQIHQGALNAGTHPLHPAWHRLKAISSASSRPRWLRFAMGLHPWWVKHDVDTALKQVEAELPTCDAIGEIGLDKNASASKKMQMAAFEHQLALAEHHRLPAILHVVGWHGLAFDCIKKYAARGMVHGFSGSRESLFQYLDRGWSIGIGHSVLSLSSTKTRAAASDVPDEHLLLETDGRASLMDVAQEVAQLRTQPVEEVLRLSAANAFRLLSDDVELLSET